MKAKLKSLIPFLITIAVGSIWLVLWIHYVTPFPERDAINQFYFPLLNYLKISLLLDADHSFITANSFLSSYPLGGAVVGWFICLIGAQSFFINNPFLICSVLIFPIACIPYFFRIDNLHRSLLGITLISLPIMQIALKGFSLHAYNVIFTILAILALRSYLARNRLIYLLIFAMCFWLAIICKHLGVFYFVNFVLAYLTWVLAYRAFDLKILASIFAIIAGSLPFYPIRNLESYLVNVITHNPYLSIQSFLLIGGLIIAIGISLIIWCKRKSSMLFLPRFNRGFLCSTSLFVFATYLTTVSYDAEIGNIDVIIYSILGYGSLIALVLQYNMSGIRGLLLLFCVMTFVNSTLLFCSMIGKTYYNFFVPIGLLIIFEYVVSNRSKQIIYLICVATISNFFPTISTLHKWMGERGENIYINGLNAVYINPLGWQRCEIPDLRNELAKRYSKVKTLQDNSLYVVTNIHFHTKLGLEFPNNYFFQFSPTYRLDHLPSEKIKEILNNYRTKGDLIFIDWIQEKIVPFIIIGQTSYTSFVGNPIETKELAKLEEPDLNEFSKSLNYAYVKFLRSQNKLSELYQCDLITTKNPRIQVCVLKSLDSMPQDLKIWNKSLSDLATRFEMDNTRPLPSWTKFIDEPNLKRLHQKRAGTLYEKAEASYGIKSNWKIYEFLRQALELDNTHVGALEDALALQKKLNYDDWKNIPKRFKPIDPEQLQKALVESRSKIKSPDLESFKLMAPEEKAQHLFILSNLYFESDPKRCIELLKKVLRLAPQHKEALKDLEVLNAQIQQKN